MGEVQRVWIVSSGGYSDYNVLAAFSTREAAERFAKNIPYTNDVEWIPLDAAPGVILSTEVYMDKDGTVVRVRSTRAGETIGRDVLGAVDFRWGGKDDEGLLHYVSPSDDETAAIKAANEIRTQILALNLWGFQHDDKVREMFSRQGA